MHRHAPVLQYAPRIIALRCTHGDPLPKVLTKKPEANFGDDGVFAGTQLNLRFETDGNLAFLVLHQTVGPILMLVAADGLEEVVAILLSVLPIVASRIVFVAL